MPIQAVVFDLDGLMVDSEPLARQAWQALLARYGHALDEVTAAAILGLRLTDSSRLIQQHYGLPLAPQQVADERHQILVELLDGNLRAMPGLYELLAAVDARGLARAVATSSGRRYAPMALRTVGAAEGFAAVVTGDDVARAKPAPDIYLAAARALSRPPAVCLALEDSPNGVSSAKAAGMVCVAVPNELTVGLDLRAADRILPSLAAVARELDDLLQLSPGENGR